MIKTPRLLLRRPLASDLDELVALDNDPEVMRWINGGLPVSRQQYEAEIFPIFLAEAGSEQLGFWIGESDRFIGWVSLRGDAEQAELGFRIRRDAWRQGFATEMAQLVLARTDSTMTIIAKTYQENIGSQKTLTGLGFVESRRYRLQPGDESDSSISDGEFWDGDDIEYVWQRP